MLQELFRVAVIKKVKLFRIYQAGAKGEKSIAPTHFLSRTTWG
jgi:hypothetical protein